ncbi:outer membrane lipoprotein carrier protein LolA, partial [bacterium]
NPKNKQAIKRSKNYLDEFKYVSNLFRFIFGFNDWQTDFKFYSLREDEESYKLVLIDKNEDKRKSKINLLISKKYLFPVEVRIQSDSFDILGKISNIKLNRKINDKKFNFQPSKDIEVWDMEE